MCIQVKLTPVRCKKIMSICSGGAFKGAAETAAENRSVGGECEVLRVGEQSRQGDGAPAGGGAGPGETESHQQCSGS